MDIVSWCNRIIKYSFYLLFILVPLILTPWNYELFEFNKMIVTYALTVVIVTAWVVKMGSQKKMYIRRTWLDIPIILFVISQLISSLFSMDPHVSWFGYYSRFNGGMLSIFCYTLLYYAFVSNWHSNTEQSHTDNQQSHSVHDIVNLQQGLLSQSTIIRLLYLTVLSGGLVVAYGILERLGIDKQLWVQDVQNRVFSTLGQPNWLAAYIVGLLPLSLHFALQPFYAGNKSDQRAKGFAFGILYFMFFITLLFTRSRSGMFAYGVVFVLFTAGNLLAKTWTKSALYFFVILHLIVGVFTFFNGTNIDKVDKYFSYTGWQRQFARQNTPATATTSAEPVAQPSGTLLEYGGTESGTIRKFVWEAAITAWRSSQKTFFIGTGTETFAFAFFQYKPIGHNLTSEWDFLYNKAHNEYLNYLATTGIFGLGSYVVILAVFILWFVNNFFTKAIRTSDDQSENHSAYSSAETHSSFQKVTITSLCIALFAGWISILITNFFGFSVVIIQIFLFLFPAFILLLAQGTHKEKVITLPRRAGQIVSIIAIILGTLGVLYVTVLWIGDYYFASGYRMSHGGQLANGYENLIQSTFWRPKEPIYYDELGVVLGSLSVASLQAGNATAASELAQASLRASDTALAISPNNVNFWKSRTKIYFGFADLDNKFVQAAKDSLEKAYTLSPNDPKITYNLAVLYGRLGENEKAIEILKKTIALKANYRDAYFALNIFYDEVKQPELAKSVLKEYLTKVDPNDKEFLEKLNK